MTEAEEIERNNTLLTVSTHLLAGFVGVGKHNSVDDDIMVKDALRLAKTLIWEVANSG